jgi:hypothetical protein
MIKDLSRISKQGSPRCWPRIFPILLLFMLCVIPISASAQAPASRQLTLIHPDDQDFETLLNGNFPGVERLDGYSIFRPYLVLLRNDTSHFAKGYAVEWETRSSIGTVHRAVNHFVQKHNSALSTERRAFGPGELRLVSPVFDVSPGEYKVQQNWVATLMSTLSTRPPYALTNTQSLTASMDAVIFADGTYAGTDRHELLLRYHCIRDAERDLAEAVLHLLDAKAPIGDVIALLERDAQAGLAANTSLRDRDSVYALYRGEQAQTLLSLYRRGGVEALMTRAWTLTQHPREKISRVSQP